MVEKAFICERQQVMPRSLMARRGYVNGWCAQGDDAVKRGRIPVPFSPPGLGLCRLCCRCFAFPVSVLVSLLSLRGAVAAADCRRFQGL